MVNALLPTAVLGTGLQYAFMSHGMAHVQCATKPQTQCSCIAVFNEYGSSFVAVDAPPAGVGSSGGSGRRCAGQAQGPVQLWVVQLPEVAESG